MPHWTCLPFMSHYCFLAMFALWTVEIPDKPPAVISLLQHLDHRADGHRNFIFLFSVVGPHGTVKDT